MVHIICCARNPGVIQTALINEFEEVVYAGKDVVHEDYGIEILVLGISLLVKGDKGSIANFSKILDTVVERPTRALRCADGDTKSDGAGECVENAEEGFCLVCGAILVDGDKDVVVTKDGRDSEEGREEVWDDVEGIVQVDGKKVLVLSTGKITSMTIERGLFLTWAGVWVKKTKAKIK